MRHRSELTAPVVGWLAHESCTVTGEVLHTRFKAVARTFVAQGPTHADRGLSIESMRDRWNEIKQDSPAMVLPETMTAGLPIQKAAADAP
jgi:hypothetical protein